MSQTPDVSLDSIDGQIVQFVQSSGNSVPYRAVANIDADHTRTLLERGILVRDPLCHLTVNPSLAVA